jgi:hypothetical protein
MASQWVPKSAVVHNVLMNPPMASTMDGEMDDETVSLKVV